MPVVIKHKCGTLLELRMDMAGKRGVCPVCDGIIVVPEHEELRKLMQKARANHLHKEMTAEGIATTAPPPADAAPPESDFASDLEDFAEMGISDIELPPASDPDKTAAPEAPPPRAAQPPHMKPPEEEKPAETAETETKHCPFCGEQMPADGIICVKCGTNIATGEKLGTVTGSEPSEKKTSKTKEDEQKPR